MQAAKSSEANPRSVKPRHPLERLLMPVEPLSLDDPGCGPVTGARQSRPVRCVRGTGSPEWLRCNDWRIRVAVGTDHRRPQARPIESFERGSGDVVEALHEPDLGVTVPFSLAEAYRGLTLEHWTSALRRRALPSSALSFFYRIKHLIPRAAQLAARRALIRAQGLPQFPTWPFDDAVAELLRFAIRCSLLARGQDQLQFRWFWPHGADAAAILTHDVESAEGLRNAVRIADLEQERDLRSSFNIVRQWYDIDWGIVDELRERGFELGVHGVFHDRSLFSSRAEFERQQPLLREAAERLDASGFRSPATHRVNAWLSELPFQYDCTISLSDPYEPQPGGCCSPWPFLLGSVVELPYTLPQDHTLFTLLGHATIALWTRQVELLERSHGLIQCLSHPDPGYLAEPANEARYIEFLDFLTERDSLWLALPREVAQWWMDRDSERETSGGYGLARLDDGAGVELCPPGREQIGI
jgi:hypothetical protein